MTSTRAGDGQRPTDLAYSHALLERTGGGRGGRLRDHSSGATWEVTSAQLVAFWSVAGEAEATAACEGSLRAVGVADPLGILRIFAPATGQGLSSP